MLSATPASRKSKTCGQQGGRSSLFEQRVPINIRFVFEATQMTTPGAPLAVYSRNAMNSDSVLKLQKQYGPSRACSFATSPRYAEERGPKLACSPARLDIHNPAPALHCTALHRTAPSALHPPKGSTPLVPSHLAGPCSPPPCRI